MYILSIDPGRSSGALVLYSKEDQKVHQVIYMPETMELLYGQLKVLSIMLSPVEHVWLERVGGHRPGNSAVATASFNRHLGELDMALYACGFWPRTTRVVPIKWQRHLAKFSSDKATRKREIRDLMLKRFPEQKERINLRTADAFGILAYGLDVSSLTV